MLQPAGSANHEERRNAIISHAMNTLEKDHGIYLARKVCKMQFVLKRDI